MTEEQRSKDYLYQLINCLLSVVASSDIYTVNHQNNVSIIARSLCQKMGFTEHEVEWDRVAAQLHDIGKVAIPNELLSKFGTLTKEEFALIKTHVSRADEILKNINFPWPVNKIITLHHERMDGSGYPLGLTGNDICMGARILAVADTTDAMINARPYRRALGIPAVIKELQNNAHYYDKSVCHAFMDLVSDGGSSLLAKLKITDNATIR